MLAHPINPLKPIRQLTTAQTENADSDEAFLRSPYKDLATNFDGQILLICPRLVCQAEAMDMLRAALVKEVDLKSTAQ